jgi:hypothetical protein
LRNDNSTSGQVSALILGMLTNVVSIKEVDKPSTSVAWPVAKHINPKKIKKTQKTLKHKQ